MPDCRHMDIASSSAGVDCTIEIEWHCFFVCYSDRVPFTCFPPSRCFSEWLAAGMPDQAFPHRSYLGGKPVIRVRQQFCRVHSGSAIIKILTQQCFASSSSSDKKEPLMWAIDPWARRAPNHRLQSPDFFLFPGLIGKYAEWKWGDFVFFRQMKVWGGIVAVWQMRLGIAGWQDTPGHRIYRAIAKSKDRKPLSKCAVSKNEGYQPADNPPLLVINVANTSTALAR